VGLLFDNMHFFEHAEMEDISTLQKTKLDESSNSCFSLGSFSERKNLIKLMFLHLKGLLSGRKNIFPVPFRKPKRDQGAMMIQDDSGLNP